MLTTEKRCLLTKIVFNSECDSLLLFDIIFSYGCYTDSCTAVKKRLVHNVYRDMSQSSTF